MKGYIYPLYAGADPAAGWIFNDPIFGAPPTLGACVPNIRRSVEVGDWVFCLSGRVKGHQPYVVGGFQVQEKIDALEAHRRYPQYRLRESPDGQVLGNIIVDGQGNKHPLDNHGAFERRLEHYLVGGDSLHIAKPDNIAVARAETLPLLSRIFAKPGNRPFDIVARWRRLDDAQVADVRDWLRPLSK